MKVGSETPDTGGNQTSDRSGKDGRRETAGRFQALNAFIDFTMGGLSRSESAVWLILYRDSRGGTARTGQADIARRAGINVRTVRRAIRRLERRGLLQVAYQGGLNRGASAYRVIALESEPH